MDSCNKNLKNLIIVIIIIIIIIFIVRDSPGNDKESNTMPSRSVIIFFEFYHLFVVNLSII